MTNLAFIALGANLGDSRRSILGAVDQLRPLSIRPLLVSSLWETEPVDCPPGSPPFLNAVVGLNPTAAETPELLLRRLQEIERDFGRQSRTVLNEPRPLDLDLVCFGVETRSAPELTLPHPRAHLRRFVLAPLAEIAPDLVWPGLGKTVRELLAALPPLPSARKL